MGMAILILIGGILESTMGITGKVVSPIEALDQHGTALVHY